MLGTPPAFILSQDQTLVIKCLYPVQNRLAILFLLTVFRFVKSVDSTVLENLLKNFQGCCLLFSYQCSLCFACLLRVSFCIIPCVSFNVKYIFQLFLHFFDLIFTYTIYVNTSFTFHIIQLYKRTEKEGFEPSRRY